MKTSENQTFCMFSGGIGGDLCCGLTVKAWCVWNHSNYSLVQIRLNGNFGSESDVAIYNGVLPKSKSFSPDFAPHIHCTKNEVFH